MQDIKIQEMLLREIMTAAKLPMINTDEANWRWVLNSKGSAAFHFPRVCYHIRTASHSPCELAKSTLDRLLFEPSEELKLTDTGLTAKRGTDRERITAKVLRNRQGMEVSIDQRLLSYFDKDAVLYQKISPNGVVLVVERGDIMGIVCPLYARKS